MSVNSESVEAFPEREQYEAALAADRRLSEWVTAYHTPGVFPGGSSNEIHEEVDEARRPFIDAIASRVAAAPPIPDGERISRHHYGGVILPVGTIIRVDVPEVGHRALELGPKHVITDTTSTRAGVYKQFLLSLMVRYPHFGFTIKDLLQVGFGKGMVYENSKRTTLSTSMRHLARGMRWALNDRPGSSGSAIEFGNYGLYAFRTFRWVYDVVDIKYGVDIPRPATKLPKTLSSLPEPAIKPEKAETSADLELKDDQFTLRGQVLDLKQAEADLLRLFYVMPKNPGAELPTKRILALLKDLYPALDAMYLDMLVSSINAKMLRVDRPDRAWLPLVSLGPVRAPKIIKLNPRVSCPPLSEEEKREIMKDMIERQQIRRGANSIDKSS